MEKESYILTFGSFIRNGKYPLEADYIFESEEALKEWEEANRKYLHEGLFKLVVLTDEQILYWYCDDTFKPVITSKSLESLLVILKDFELHGTLRDLLKDINELYSSKFNAIQLELDTTQSGVGLNGDGSFDLLNMKNTTYLDGSRSVIEALKALDREMTNLVVDAFIQDAYYDTTTEDIVITFVTKQDKTKTIRISVANLIREWEVDNTIPDKVVELSRLEIHGGGADKLSADVRISTNKDNILLKDGNSLLVKGTSENIKHLGTNVKEALIKLQLDVDSFINPEPKVFNKYQDALDSELKLGDTFLLTLDDIVGIDIFPDIEHENGVIYVRDDTKLSDLKINLYNQSGTLIAVNNPADGKLTIDGDNYYWFDIPEVSGTITTNFHNAEFTVNGPTVQSGNTYSIALTTIGYTTVTDFKTEIYYKGLYIITEEGPKLLTLDEDFKEVVKELITDITNLLDTKVDKVEGKGLSTNDFSDYYKHKVDISANPPEIILTGVITTNDANSYKMNYTRQLKLEDGNYTSMFSYNTTISAATTAKAGLMTAADKEAFDELCELTYANNTALSMSGSSTTIEKGVDNIITVSWNLTFNGKAVTPTSITIKKGDAIIGSNVNNKSITDTISLSTTYTTTAVYRGVTKTSTRTYNAYYPKYYGGSTNTELISSAEITALPKQSISSSATGTYTITSNDNEYIWFCIPMGMNINKVTLGGFAVPLLTSYNINVDGKLTYKVYRTANPLSAGTRSFVIS